MADYPDFRKPISIAQQEVDLDTVIQACNAIINTVITGQTVDINQIITGQTIDIKQIINGQNIGVANKRDWAAEGVELKYVVFVPVFPVAAGAEGYSDIYEVPAGRRYFVSDCYGSTTFRGELTLYVPDSHYIYSAHFEPWATHPASLALPIPVEEGQTIRIYWKNSDAFAGTFEVLVGLWWIPGSVWKKPDTDDPWERFKAGDWEFAKYFLNNDGSYWVVFRRHKEKKSNFLKISNAYNKNEKKLASGILEANEVKEIFDATHKEPDKLKEVLEKYDRKNTENKIC
jgi:hypothetical protein